MGTRKEENMRVLATWYAEKMKECELAKDEERARTSLRLWKSVARYADEGREENIGLTKEDVYQVIQSTHSEAEASRLLSRLRWDSVPYISSVVAECNPYMGRRLLLRSDYDLKRVKSWIVDNYPCDFCWSIHFDPKWVRELMAEGFLPITSEIVLPKSPPKNIAADEAELTKLFEGDDTRVPKDTERTKKKRSKKKKKGLRHTFDTLISGGESRRRRPRPTSAYIMLPKLHQSRCVVFPITTFHVGKNARKRSKRFELSVDQDFEGVVDGCRKQHGMNWLSPPIVDSFRAMVEEQRVSSKKPPHAGVTLHSFELWDRETGKLVAGELGYSVDDKIYTSLTGFYAASGAGTVQLACAGRLLAARGFLLWDLGMFMAYKKDLGAKQMARKHFVRAIERIRARSVEAKRGSALLLATRTNAREVIDLASSPS